MSPDLPGSPKKTTTVGRKNSWETCGKKNNLALLVNFREVDSFRPFFDVFFSSFCGTSPKFPQVMWKNIRNKSPTPPPNPPRSPRERNQRFERLPGTFQMREKTCLLDWSLRFKRGLIKEVPQVGSTLSCFVTPITFGFMDVYGRCRYESNTIQLYLQCGPPIYKLV